MKVIGTLFVVITRWLLKAIFFFGLFFISVGFPVFFGIVTFFLSLLIFSRLEYAKKVHERTFYSIAEPSKIISAFLSLLSQGEVLIKSLIFGVLTTILFSGTNDERITSISLVFILLVWLGAFFLNFLEKSQSKVDVEKWGYVKISLLLGIAFSLLISAIDGVGVWEITKFIVVNESGGLSLNEGAELIYGLFSKLDEALESIFVNLFGGFIGKSISLFLTANITYGFVVYIYVVQYHRLKKRYDRKRKK